MPRLTIEPAGPIYRVTDPALSPLAQELERRTRNTMTILPQGTAYTAGQLWFAEDIQTLVTLDIGTNVPPQVLGVNTAETAPTWQTASVYLAHNLLSPTHTDTVAASPTQGDLIVGDATPNWAVLPVGGPGAPLVVNAGGNAPLWVVPAPAAGQLLHFNGADTVFTTTMTYTDATRILAFTGGAVTVTGTAAITIQPTTTLDVEIGGLRVSRHAAGEFNVGRAGRRLLATSDPDGTGRLGTEMWPDDFTITTATGIGAFLFWDSTITTNVPAGGGVGNDTMPGGINMIGTIIFQDQGNVFASGLLFNAQATIQAQANVGPLYVMLDQFKMIGDGGSFTGSQHNALRLQPIIGPNINGGSFTQLTADLIFMTVRADATVGTASWTTVSYLAAKSPALTSGGTVGTLNVLDIVDIVGPTTIRGINSAMNNGTFINHTGTAPSAFAGDVRMNDSVSMLFGSSGSNGVGISREAAGVIRMLGFGGSTEGLDFNFSGVDNVRITSAPGTNASLNIDTIEFVFGPGLTADGTNNFVMAFSPGLRATQLAADYSEVLFTTSSSISVANAIPTFSTWSVDAVNMVLTGGSVTNATNVLIKNNVNQGTNDRSGLRITSNPTGGAGVNAALHITAGLSRFDGRVDINNGIALGGGATALLGTIGGAGPTVAAQAQWVEIDVAGVAHWIPAWT